MDGDSQPQFIFLTILWSLGLRTDTRRVHSLAGTH
jgi:hypothetical protein